jgi:hypothetical protein
MSRAVRAITALALVAAVAATGGIIRLKDDTSACTIEKAAGDKLKHSCDVTTGSASLRNLDDVLSTLQICPAGQGVDDATQRCADCVAGQTFNGRVDYMGCAAAQTSLKCPKGEGRDPATKESDFYCTACSGGAGGNYSDVNGVANCLPTTPSKTCGAGQGRVTATAQKDYHCINCVSEGCTAGGSTKCSYNSDPTSQQACSPTAPGGHTCGLNQGWVYSTTTSNGYDCETCFAAGEDPRYSDTIDNTQCKDTPSLKKECPAGKGWTYSGSLAGGYDCTPCVAGSSFSAANDRQQCDTNVVKPTCGAGRGVVADPTVQDGYRCEDCLDEAAGRYGWSTANNKAACTPTIKPSSHTCPKGQGWIYSGDSATGYDCEVCVAGSEYSDSNGVQQCQAAAKVICPAGKGYVADNQVSSGYKCQDCLSPSGGRYMWSNTNDNTACKSKTTPYGTTCALGKGWIHSGSASGGYTCETCVDKSPKAWSDTNDDTQCATTGNTKKKCPAGKGWVYDGTKNGGYDCQDCVDEDEGRYGYSTANNRLACSTTASGGKACPLGQGWVYAADIAGGYKCEECLSGSEYSNSILPGSVGQCKTATKIDCNKGFGNVADPTVDKGWKCESCDPGQYQHLDNNAGVCQDADTSKSCGIGEGWDYDTKVNKGIKCVTCTPGTSWSSVADHTQCQPMGNKQPCVTGRGNWAVNDASTGWTCKDCPSGKYSPSTSATECDDTGAGNCPNGKYYVLSTSTSPGFTCQNCAKASGSSRGQWKTGNDKSGCKNCPEGKYTSSDGASSCSDSWNAQEYGSCQALDNNLFSSESAAKLACETDSNCKAVSKRKYGRRRYWSSDWPLGVGFPRDTYRYSKCSGTAHCEQSLDNGGCSTTVCGTHSERRRYYQSGHNNANECLNRRRNQWNQWRDYRGSKFIKKY